MRVRFALLHQLALEFPVRLDADDPIIILDHICSYMLCSQSVLEESVGKSVSGFLTSSPASMSILNKSHQQVNPQKRYTSIRFSYTMFSWSIREVA